MTAAHSERQATVASFDPTLRTTSVLFDDGTRAQLPAEVVGAAGLLLLRPGQRVKVRLDDAGAVLAVALLTLPFA